MNQNNAVTVSPVTIRGVKRWRVRYHENGRVKRAHFSARDTADSHAAKLRSEAVGARKRLATLPQSRLDQLVLLNDEAERRGVDLLTLLTLLQSAEGKPAGPTLKAVIAELNTVWTKGGRDETYVNQLDGILNDFCDSCPADLPINKGGLAEVEQFLNTKNLVSRGGYRTRLSTLLNFAIRRGYVTNNPCQRLEPIRVTRPAPHIFTPDEVATCATWLQKHPKTLGHFVLSTFAGLRPEEAAKTTWNEINFEEQWIRVEAQTTKVRQRRVVYPPKMAFAWLRAAKETGAKLTTSRATRNRVHKRLCKLLGWSRWKKDVTRHSAASYWLSNTGEAAAIATALGHSEKILRKNYMGLCTRVEAEKFWALRPSKPPNTPSTSAPTPSTASSKSSSPATPTSTSSTCNSTTPTPTTPTPPSTGC